MKKIPLFGFIVAVALLVISIGNGFAADPAFLAEVDRPQGGVGKWEVETWVGAKFFPSTIAEDVHFLQDPSTRLGAE